jgi:YegS/Rv2252/BmrU family lipid kinase
MLLIFNPKAGTQKFPSNLFEVVNLFTASGFLVTVYPTQNHTDIAEILPRVIDTYDYLVCSGGDGTTCNVIDTLASLNKRPYFGIIPSGTVNDFAVSLGISKDITTAADTIVRAFPKAIDIGLFGSKYFTYVAAFGKYTDVSYTTPQSTKNLFGKLAYFLEGIKRTGTPESHRCTFTLDGETIGGDFALGIISNAYSIAGVKLPEEMDIQLNDGYFEVILVHAPSTLLQTQKIISSLLTQEIKTDLIIFRKAKQISFTSTKPVAWTLDGEFGGEHTELTITNQYRAIEIIMPES